MTDLADEKRGWGVKSFLVRDLVFWIKGKCFQSGMCLRAQRKRMNWNPLRLETRFPFTCSHKRLIKELGFPMHYYLALLASQHLHKATGQKFKVSKIIQKHLKYHKIFSSNNTLHFCKSLEKNVLQKFKRAQMF